MRKSSPGAPMMPAFAAQGSRDTCGRYLQMAIRREIDERDIDRLLAALTDRQIADLYGMSELEVSQLRQARRAKQFSSRVDTSQGKKNPGS